jgi:beta-lactamase regulating signal transducer with metallopeptidase domain
MSLLIQYLVKLSISLAIVCLFYQFVLRRLTFYNNNRWYLLFFTAISFFIPFINISFIQDNASQNGLIQFIPSVHQYTLELEQASHCPAPIWSTQYDKWDWTAFALMAGAAFLFIRFVIRYISFIRIRSKAELISDDEIKIYQVDESIIPFSFGNAVFINCNQHSSEELEEIVRHEFVHVRQKHTIDIIWAELVCILNWYNPFAWLLKKSIRQNLEFIADDKVIENGIDKKQYQYLLLKVIGNNQYSIATQFNFSSLKKRIAMMNKTKSTRKQVARFLFLLPVLAVILLSFRKSFSDNSINQTGEIKPAFIDTIPEVTEPNNKGYLIDVKDKNGECLLVIKDKNKKEVTRMLLSEWNKKADYYENLYGEIPPAPAKPAKAADAPLPTMEQWIKAANKDVKSVSVVDGLATVTLKNGKKENYDLTKKEQKENFEKKYGEIPEPPLPPSPAQPGQPAQIPPMPVKATQPGEPALPAAPPAPPSKVIGVKPKEGVKADFELNDNVITVTPVNGVKEVYNLKNAKEKKLFEEKYGDPVLAESITTSVNANVNTIVNPVLASTAKSNLVTNINVNPVTVANTDINAANIVNAKLTTTVANPVKANITSNVNVNMDPMLATTVNANINVDINIKITRNTTEDELNKLITQLKHKGYELKFTNKNFNDGALTNISGTIKHNGSNSSFTATDFSSLTITAHKDDGETKFNIYIKGRKEVI